MLRGKTTEFIRNLQVEVVPYSKEVDEIATEFVEDELVPINCIDEGLPLATALLYDLDFVVSWNHKLLVNIRTKRATRILAAREGFKDIEIITPYELIPADDIEEPKAMREIHEIRARHYEETKNLTRKEYIKGVRENVREFLNKYGLE